jgi:hypothetical protein
VQGDALNSAFVRFKELADKKVETLTSDPSCAPTRQRGLYREMFETLRRRRPLTCTTKALEFEKPSLFNQVRCCSKWPGISGAPAGNNRGVSFLERDG